MFLLPYILNLLIKTKEQSFSFIMLRLLGYFLIIIAVGLVAYFIFLLFIPLVGYELSGLLIGGGLAGMGLFFLIMSRAKKVVNPIDELVNTAIHAFKSSYGRNMLKDNSVSIVVLALVSGFVLSQFILAKKRVKVHKRVQS